MRVLMVSKALVVGTYQKKLEEIAQQPGLELTCIVPPSWRQDGRELVVERVHTRGYDLVVEPVRWNGRFHLFFFPGLSRQIQRLRPDIVHLDEEPYNLATYLGARSCRRQGARLLFFTWQNIYRRYPLPFRLMERTVYRCAAGGIAGNADAVRVLRAKGFRGPVEVIPQFGISPDTFFPSSDAPARHKSHRLAIGYVGRLVEEKGLWVLLDAVRGLKGDWTLDLLGHGPLRQPLLARIEALGLTDRVRVCPAVSSVEVPARLRQMDVLVLPSLSRPNWKEQFGRALIEAMACGVAVIGSRSGEIPNVIGEAGLTFPEGDSAQLRERLQLLLDSPGQRLALSAQGRLRVLERFTHQRIAEQTVQFYQRLLQSP